jgi:hypothetical protein
MMNNGYGNNGYVNNGYPNTGRPLITEDVYIEGPPIMGIMTPQPPPGLFVPNQFQQQPMQMQQQPMQYQPMQIPIQQQQQQMNYPPQPVLNNNYPPQYGQPMANMQGGSPIVIVNSGSNGTKCLACGHTGGCLRR